jgi:hypothetical protein
MFRNHIFYRFICFIRLFVVFLQRNQKNEVMTATVRIIQSSSMAPILEMTKGADIEVMHAVIEYLQESIREAEETKRKAEDVFLAKAENEMGNGLSESFLKLRGCVSFTPEEIAADDRLAYILNK